MIKDTSKTAKSFMTIPENEDIYEILLENIYGLVVIRNKDHKVVWLNNNAKEAFTERNIDWRTNECIVPEQECDTSIIHEMNAIDEKIYETKKGILNIPFGVKCPSCEQVLYRVDKIPYRDSTGEIEGVVTFMLNVNNAQEYEIEKYKQDIRFHNLRSALGNIIKK